LADDWFQVYWHAWNTVCGGVGTEEAEEASVHLCYHAVAAEGCA
jgi:hypothetical protein